MSKNTNKQLLIGLISGLIIPIMGILIVLSARPEILGIQQMDADIVKVVNTQIITLGIIINAVWFFICLKLDKEEISRGTLLATVAYLLIIVVYRFLL